MILINLLPHREAARKRRKEAFYATLGAAALLGGLMANLQFNLNRKQSRVRLFEIGCCFVKTDEAYVQPEKLAGLCYGDAVAEQWGTPARKVDFYDAKADVEALFWPQTVTFAASPQAPHPALHPGRSAQISVAGKHAHALFETSC